MIVNRNLFGIRDKVEKAIARIKKHAPEEGYYLAYSGGKDSDVVLALTKMAGVKYEIHYHLTTVDPPELVYHVRRHSGVIIDRPKTTMWKLIRKKHFPPTRRMRYCCYEFKERYGAGRVVLTGLRRSESYRRRSRPIIEQDWYDPTKILVNPIVDWTEYDVWEFIHTFRIDYCKLYDKGLKRLGCVMCPFSDVKKEMKMFPKFAEAYRRAIIRAYNEAPPDSSVRKNFQSGEEVWLKWISGTMRRKLQERQKVHSTGSIGKPTQNIQISKTTEIVDLLF